MLLGIDIGTGGCKTTLINQCGMYISDGFAEYETYHPKLSWSEQKPADWFPAFLKALKAAERKGKVSRKDIIGMSVSASSHNAVLLDAHNAVLRDTIMWTDQRSYEESEYLKKTFGERIFQIGYHRSIGLRINFFLHTKIVKVESRKTSLLDFYTETHPILSKDSESRKQKNKLA